MLTRLLALPDHVLSGLDHSALRLIVSSGSALCPATVRAAGPLRPGAAQPLRLHRGLLGECRRPGDLHHEPGSAGRPPLGTRLTVLDSEGLPCPIGVSGRIFVGNSMLFDGYTDHSPVDTDPTA